MPHDIVNIIGNAWVVIMNLYLQIDKPFLGKVIGRGHLRTACSWGGEQYGMFLSVHRTREATVHPFILSHVQPYQLCLELLIGSRRHVKILRFQVCLACFSQCLLPESDEILRHRSESLDLLRRKTHLHQVAITLAVHVELILTG